MMQLNDHIQHSNFNVFSESILKTFMKLVSQIHHRLILHCFHLKARERTDRHKHTRAHTYTLRIRSCKFALTSLSDDFFFSTIRSKVALLGCFVGQQPSREKISTAPQQQPEFSKVLYKFASIVLRYWVVSLSTLTEQGGYKADKQSCIMFMSRRLDVSPGQ
jgi:hypothetical protein